MILSDEMGLRGKGQVMVEPVNRWQPVTEEYQAQAAAPAQIEDENQRRLDAIRKAKPQKVWKETKAPLGIKIFTWYLFCRAGFYAVLWLFLASFPQTAVSTWMVGNLGDLLHMPRSAASEAAAQRKALEKEAEANGYSLPDTAETDPLLAEPGPDDARTRVMVYLLFLMGSTLVVAFMWWNRSWKIRWVAMFYAGAFVARAAIVYLAAIAAGAKIPLSSGQTLAIAVSLCVNAFVFCYLAFWPDVPQWFEEQH